MTNSTFPVFLMDNIRLCSPGKGTPVSWLDKETGCPRIGYLNVPPVFFLLLWLIIIRTAGQGKLLLCVGIISSTFLNLMN